MSVPNIAKNGSKRNTIGKEQRKKRRRSEIAPIQEEITQTPSPLIQRVFLYIQLDGIQNLPKTPYPLEIHLYHTKNTLQKMSEHYTTETIIYENEFELKRPTFTLTVIQDDIEEMNIFSDNPLIISLYERVPRLPRMRTKANKTNQSTIEMGDVKNIVDMSTAQIEIMVADEGEGEEGLFDEEHLKFVSRGYCDLLQLFQRNRFIANVDVFLYPDISIPTNEPYPTTLTKWHMYTILPILKADTFTNLAFITLESLYNLNTDLIPNAEDLCVNLSFRSTKPNEDGNYHIVPLCNFYGMYYLNISEQHTCIAWENMKRDLDLRHRRNIGQTRSTSSIKLPKLFYKLLYTEGIDFHINEIDPVEDMAMVNNSWHRFVLNEEMCAKLVDIVTHNTYQLQVEVFRQEYPEIILYDGLINLSIFAYPNINLMRFACALRQLVNVNSKSTITTMKTPFAVIKICFFRNITEKNMPLDQYNLSVNQKNKLLHCTPLILMEEDDEDIVKELYRLFDELISAIMLHIIKHQLRSIDDRREYFCCQLANLHNILLKLCGCDFNVRMPTTNNIEFREMITHMFKELMDRVYLIIMSCGRLCLYHCFENFDKDNQKLLELFNSYKLLIILGDEFHTVQLYDQMNNLTENAALFKFFVFLHDIETGNFKAALSYSTCKKANQDWGGDYFMDLCGIYVRYMQELSNIHLADSVAFEHLIEALNKFAKVHFLDIDSYMLLYCYYKQSKYLPGMEYTRWRFENLYNVSPKLLNYAPMPLYNIYLTIDPELKTQRSQKFYQVYKLFIQMGLYNFAEQIFDEIRSECSNIEQYLMTTVLKMLLKTIDNRFVLSNIKTDNTDRGKLLSYYLMHVNGNLEFERTRYDKAEDFFSKLLNIEDKYEEWLPLFRLSFLRLGKIAFDAKHFELAELAYRRCRPSDDAGISFIANYGLGKVLYYMGRLTEAISEFAKCTNVQMHAPNVWGYLAVINLRLKDLKLALECWKMAKLYPEMSISDDVYVELAKINPSTCSLLVQ